MTLVLWGVGRYPNAIPIQLAGGSLAEMRRELAYRERLQATGFHGLTLLEEGTPYPVNLLCTCGCGTRPGMVDPDPTSTRNYLAARVWATYSQGLITLDECVTELRKV